MILTLKKSLTTIFTKMMANIQSIQMTMKNINLKKNQNKNNWLKFKINRKRHQLKSNKANNKQWLLNKISNKVMNKVFHQEMNKVNHWEMNKVSLKKQRKTVKFKKNNFEKIKFSTLKL